MHEIELISQLQENCSCCKVLQCNLKLRSWCLCGHAWRTELPFQLGKIFSCRVHFMRRQSSMLHSLIAICTQMLFYCPLSFTTTPQYLLQPSTIQQPQLRTAAYSIAYLQISAIYATPQQGQQKILKGAGNAERSYGDQLHAYIRAIVADIRRKY